MTDLGKQKLLPDPMIGRLADWDALEKSGRIIPPPGRDEAVAATVARTAAKKAAESAAKLPKGK
jgi:hypothetical protein